VSLSPALSSPPSTAEFLTPEKTSELREALLRCRREREQQLTALAMVPLPPETDVVALAHADSVRQVVALIDAALARVDAGTYGACVHCSSPIPHVRLEVMPYADSCVPCRARRAGR
jgi:RNA polymerase-binding transcription factor DksA